MNVFGMPVMSKIAFVQTERDIGEVWEREMEKAMLEAGKEEKRLAEQRGDYHQGIPAITVVMVVGPSIPINIHIMQNLEWELLAKKLVRFHT